MVICPKCKAENRPEAAFCARCGTILFAQPASTKPAEQPSPSIPQEQPSPIVAEEPPVLTKGFSSRPEGSVFGDRFQYNAVFFQTVHEVHYTVTEINQPNNPSVRICSNPQCHTIHCPVGLEVEKFCTQCGQPLEERSPLLTLVEADSDKFSNIQPLIDLHLVHPNIHPPVATFQQELPGGVRYYLVTPYSQNMPSQAQMDEVLEWGVQLAQGLDYLQSKGIVLGGELDSSSIGIAEGRVVWRNFSSARILKILTDREKINNVRLLALALFSWMTSKTTYSLDPYLPPALNDLFQKALEGEGFTSSAEFANQVRLAKAAGLARLNLDYQVGRGTHPGKVRLSNEDSLLSMELTSIQQGIIQPVGLFAIADGMGGHASGEQASSLAIDSIAQIGAIELLKLQNPSFEEFENWIKTTMHSANLAVYKARQTAGNDMGSTLVIGLIIGSQAYLGHLGDSRIYLVNKESIKQLTTDHSLVQRLISLGKISQEESRFHPQRNIIYRSLGEKAEVEADYFNQILFPSDRLLFCSDGLTNVLDDPKILEIIMEASTAQSACDRLIDEANAAGGEDNISVIVVEVRSI